MGSPVFPARRGRGAIGRLPIGGVATAAGRGQVRRQGPELRVGLGPGGIGREVRSAAGVAPCEFGRPRAWRSGGASVNATNSRL